MNQIQADLKELMDSGSEHALEIGVVSSFLDCSRTQVLDLAKEMGYYILNNSGKIYIGNREQKA